MCLTKGYRAYTVSRMPNLRVLDYVKIGQAERAMSGDAAAAAASKTGVGAATAAAPLTSLTEEDKAALKVAVAKATTKAELETLMTALKTGVLPPGFNATT